VISTFFVDSFLTSPKELVDTIPVVADKAHASYEAKNFVREWW
jgi:hypothetical protein